MEEFDRHEQDADHQQNEGDVRVVKRVQKRLDQVLVDRGYRRALGVNHDLTGRGRDRLAVGLSENVVHARGNAVDSVGRQRFLGRVRLGSLNRGHGPRHGLWMAFLGDTPHRGDRIVHDLVGFRLAVGRGDVGSADRNR